MSGIDKETVESALDSVRDHEKFLSRHHSKSQESSKGKDAEDETIIKAGITTQISESSTHTKNSDMNFENDFNEHDLAEIETNFASLSSNFKKRRLSKNEMDFLETELNLDIDNITEADFDMHLQKLISDNENPNTNSINNIINNMGANLNTETNIEVSNDENNKNTGQDEVEGSGSGSGSEQNLSKPMRGEEIDFSDKRTSVTETSDSVIESERNAELDDKSETDVPKVISSKPDDSKTDIEVELENAISNDIKDAAREAIANELSRSTSKDENETSASENRQTDNKASAFESVGGKTKENADQNITESRNVDQNESTDLQSTGNSATEEPVVNKQEETLTDTSKSNLKEKELSKGTAKQKNGSKMEISTTSTSTYKGVSIPSNSELFKSNDTDTVLKAYKTLLRDSGRNLEANHTNAQLAALPLLINAPDHLSFNVQMLINTLPVLDNLATQILRIIAKGPYQKVMELVSNRESYTGIAFSNLVELFETTKRIYNSEESPFFTVENITFGLWKYGTAAPTFLRGREDTIEGTLRKVNLSTFLLATLGLIDLGFFFLNEAFLDVFCPPQHLDPADSLSLLKNDDKLNFLSHNVLENKVLKVQKNQSKFLKAQAILYLELKTQAYISAIELGDRSKEEIIHDLFPSNMDEILIRRKDPYFDGSGVKLERNSALFTPAELDFLNRCDFRKQSLLASKDDSSLMEKYEWIKFLNDLLEYVSKNVGFLIWGPKGKLSSELDKINTMKKIMNDSSALSKIIKREMSEDSNNNGTTNNKDESELGDYNGENKRKADDGEEGNDVHEKRSSSNQGNKVKRQKQNRPSTFRRIWTKEEEDALKEGLKLKGTHWTAILELYGPGGTINENLKNRSSLQLKDKARNWKLYYLKNKLPLPDYLEKPKNDEEKRNKNTDDSAPKRPKSGNKAVVKTYQTNDGFNNSSSLVETSVPSGSVDSIDETDVYKEMFGALLPGDKNDDKHDESVPSELKDLVAEAFK